MATKPGLYANIHKKQERIERQKAEGKPVERMRTPGSKGAPTAAAFSGCGLTSGLGADFIVAAVGLALRWLTFSSWRIICQPKS